MQRTNLPATSQASEALAAQLEKISSIDSIAGTKHQLEQFFLQWNTTEWACHQPDRNSFQLITYCLLELLETLPSDEKEMDLLIAKIRKND